MKKLTIVFLSFLLLFPLLSQAQFSEDVWHPGEVDLTTGETISGKIKYNLNEDNILLLVDDVVQFYNVNKVEAFAINDAVSKTTRYFFAIPYTLQQDYNRPHFFELLTEGQVSLLTRQQLVKRVKQNVANPQLVGSNTYPVVEAAENYFLMDANGEIRACGNSNREVLKFFNDESKKLKAFINENKLNVSIRQDMMYVVNYYNQLKEQK